MSSRRSFIRQSALAAGALAVHPALNAMLAKGSGLEISLAQWSLHKQLFAGQLDHLDFAAKAKKDFGISAVEYVTSFFGSKKVNFKEAGKDKNYLNEMLKRSKDNGVVNHLIMVDGEGNLAQLNEKERLQAIDNHKKWVEAAKLLGCKTIRVNLAGEGSKEGKRVAGADSLGRLGDFAKTMNINVIVENHGGDSSNAAWLASVMKEANRPNVGTLPDFGNFCISGAWGGTEGGCKEKYDTYKGVTELMPFAKGVSAKTYDFREDGEESSMDYKRLIDIVKASGFKGYIGIEYEGEKLSEEEGIRKTKQLLEKYI